MEMFLVLQLAIIKVFTNTVCSLAFNTLSSQPRQIRFSFTTLLKVFIFSLFSKNKYTFHLQRQTLHFLSFSSYLIG